MNYVNSLKRMEMIQIYWTGVYIYREKNSLYAYEGEKTTSKDIIKVGCYKLAIGSIQLWKMQSVHALIK